MNLSSLYNHLLHFCPFCHSQQLTPHSHNLVRSGAIVKLKVKELCKYLAKHNIPIAPGMIKADKIEAIRSHFYHQQNISDSSTSSDTDSYSDSDNDSSDSDIVEREFGSPEVSESEIYMYTRSGRRATTWKTRRIDEQLYKETVNYKRIVAN